MLQDGITGLVLAQSSESVAVTGVAAVDAAAVLVLRSPGGLHSRGGRRGLGGLGVGSLSAARRCGFGGHGLRGSSFGKSCGNGLRRENVAGGLSGPARDMSVWYSRLLQSQ
jgi:hypothetical protein